jgi:hypothetical protein
MEEQETRIVFRAVIEVLGKPKEHVEASIKKFLENLRNDEKYKVIKDELAEIKKQEDMWAIFAELELTTEKIENLTNFCFEYMPSVIEVVEPKEIKLADSDFSQFLNDLQAKLHQVDMVAKHVKMENDFLKRGSTDLLKNYITVLLSKGNLTSDQLSKLTGVVKDKLEDYLDMLIDEKRIDLKEGIYFLVPKDGTK